MAVHSGHISQARAQRGYSVIELVIVLALMLILAAVAVVNIRTVYTQYRLGTLANEVAGMLQRTRSAAVLQNAPAYLQINSGLFTISVNTAFNQQLFLPGDIAVSTSPPVQLTAADLGASLGTATNPTLASASTQVYFNSRGIPCDPTNTACITPLPKSAYAYYFTKDNKWVAVSVNPAGRVGIWTWSGSAWKQQK